MSEKPLPIKTLHKREARVAAVKALYTQQIYHQHDTIEELILEVISYYDESIPELEGAELDKNMFSKLVKGATEHRSWLNEMIEKNLTEGWKLPRLGAVLHAILLVGAYELAYLKETPTKTAINEYVDIAHAFFFEQEASFVNAILDAISKEVRD